MLCDYVHDQYAPDVVLDTMNLSITVGTPRDDAGAGLRSVTRMTYSITLSAATEASTSQLALEVRSEITAGPALCLTKAAHSICTTQVSLSISALSSMTIDNAVAPPLQRL